MSFRSVWRRGSVLVLGAALVSGAFLGALTVSAQSPPGLPSLAIVGGVRGATGAAVTSGTVTALIGTTTCQSKPLGANIALEIGQPNQPEACKVQTGTISFTVDGARAAETIPVKPGVPQAVSLTLAAAAAPAGGAAAPAGGGAAAPAPAKTGNGGYLGSDSDAGTLALGFGVIALAAVGGSLVVRRVRR